MPTQTLHEEFSERARIDDARSLRNWLALAAGSLIVAGFFAALLVVGRAPFLAPLITDPGFFRRCLVVHVDLSIVVWFYAFLGGLFRLVPARGASARLPRASVWIATAGVVLLVLAAGMTHGAPVLSNYIPMIDHPLFAAGLVVFGAGVALSFFDRRLLPGEGAGRGVIALPPAAVSALRSAAIAFLLALLTFGASLLSTPAGLEADAFYESLFWGGGHVLQFASVLGMLAVWLILLTPVLGRSPVGARTGAVFTGLLVAPLLGAPLLAMQGTNTATYRLGFMKLMQFGIFPVVSVVLLLCVVALVKGARNGTLAKPLTDLRVLGFAASAGLTIAGFILGAMIRGSNTMVPAHYHAAIGAVTVAFMTVTFVLLEPLGLRMPKGRALRLARLQPVLFGGGQLLFALGFGLAGAHGMGRKVYGAEQQVRTVAEWLGLAVMGLGGLVAIAAGLLFLTLLGLAWRARGVSHRTPSERNAAWQEPNASIPSRN